MRKKIACAILLIMIMSIINILDYSEALNYTMDSDLSNVDASFWGEDSDDHSGWSVAGGGDVNGDGYDDILIGAWQDDDGGAPNAGQTYLIFGKASGWAMDTDLSNADASFWGEDAGDFSGYTVTGVGDVNGDEYDEDHRGPCSRRCRHE